MSFIDIKGIAAVCGAVVCAAAGPSLAQDEAVQVLQGGFEYSDPEIGPVSAGGGVEGWTLSLGNTVLSGGRIRTAVVDPLTTRVCVDLNYTLQASESIKRDPDKLKQKQKSGVQIQFVFFNCPLNPTCVLGTSEPVAVAGCKGFTKTNNGAKAGPEAKVGLLCKEGIDADDPAFDLSANELFWAETAFPEIIDKLKIKYKDEAAVQVPDDEVESLADPTLGRDDCF